MRLKSIKGFDRYHAHLYFDVHTSNLARSLCREAGDRFELKVGRHHEKTVGPHPRWSCQLAFDAQRLEEVINWLDEHRNGLTVFVHGLSGNDLADHSDHVFWLGKPEPINLAVFSE